MLCSVINDTADKSTEYWLLDCIADDRAAKALTAEFVIVGKQSRIIQLISALGVQDQKLVVPGLDDLATDLYGALSAGNFQVVGRAPDFIRASNVQNVAAQMNGALREALAVHIA